MRSIGLIVTFAGIMLGSAGDCPAGGYEPKVGVRHPDFTLPRIDDRKPVSLSDFRGKKVLLIHFASW